MHELSVVQSLLETIESYAAEQKATTVTKVIVRNGPLSGVVPDLLRTTFDTFKEKTIAEDAELVIGENPLLIQCHDCKQEVRSMIQKFACPICGSRNVDARGGDDLILERLEMDVADDPD
ncbi:MAG: hydrogenase maturation nickel metallochaperone HypA [Deltaproteobacteria bacterium]|nr:hydrogenase maturation nickel metallochaperone HypA [Deltaproteobacteria bacterium]